MSNTEQIRCSLSAYYTEKEIEQYTKQLAQLGVTNEAEVVAVLDFIHKIVRIAVDEYYLMNNNGFKDNLEAISLHDVCK